MKAELNLKNLRKSKCWSQKRLANQINRSIATVSLIENCKLTPNLQTMQKLADALDVDLQTIVACFVQDNRQQKTKKE